MSESIVRRLLYLRNFVANIKMQKSEASDRRFYTGAGMLKPIIHGIFCTKYVIEYFFVEQDTPQLSVVVIVYLQIKIIWKGEEDTSKRNGIIIIAYNLLRNSFGISKYFVVCAGMSAFA